MMSGRRVAPHYRIRFKRGSIEISRKRYYGQNQWSEYAPVSQEILQNIISQIDRERLRNLIEDGVENARYILSNPVILYDLINKLHIANKESGQDVSVARVIREMIRSVENDTNFLKNIINIYRKAPDDFRQGCVCALAIRNINLIDDAFFKRIFEESTDPQIRAEAIAKIKDQVYLKRFVEELGNKDERQFFEGAWMNSASKACSNVIDQNFLERIASDETKNRVVREQAMLKLNNIQILRKFARGTERIPREAALRRLTQLHQSPTDLLDD